MRMYILPLGDCCVVNEVIAPGVQDGKRIHIPVCGYLIETDGGECVLVDTGMNKVHITDPEYTWRGQPLNDMLVPVMRPEDSLLRRLAEIDVGPADIKHVINTHLHFDHAGNNELLRDATFFVQRGHYEVARNNPAFPNEYWNLPHLNYELIEGEPELFRGIQVVLTPGHAPFHQSVLLRLPETGNVILCGDAIYCQDNIDHDSWEGQADPTTASASAKKLQELAHKEQATMIYGHDPGQAGSLRFAPFYYE